MYIKITHDDHKVLPKQVFNCLVDVPLGHEQAGEMFPLISVIFDNPEVIVVNRWAGVRNRVGAGRVTVEYWMQSDYML